jgi:hypothetical protein
MKFGLRFYKPYLLKWKSNINKKRAMVVFRVDEEGELFP